MSFKSSLRVGSLGETLYFNANCNHLIRNDGRASDFTDKTTGEGVELKSDMWNMDKTPNFFFERHSDVAKGSPGGPWQALSHGSTTFVYFFVANLTYFTFKTAELVEKLELIIPTLKPVEVKNATWTTVGYRVPREELSSLYKATTLTVSIS